MLQGPQWVMKTRALRREEDGAGSTRVGHPRGRAGWVGALVPGLSGYQNVKCLYTEAIFILEEWILKLGGR